MSFLLNPFDWISNHSIQNDSEPRHEEYKLSDEETKAQTSNQDIVTLNSDSSYSTEPITNQARVHKWNRKNKLELREVFRLIEQQTLYIRYHFPDTKKPVYRKISERFSPFDYTHIYII